MRTTRTFAKIVSALDDGHPRYIDCCGGARSGKTFANLQLLYLLAEADKRPTLTSVVSETLPHLKRGAIRDFFNILTELGKWDDNAWNKSDNVYTLPNGSRIEFFSVDQPSKVLGAARERLFVNEGINIKWDTFRQLDIRTKEFCIIDYNPSYAFWMHEHLQPNERTRSIVSTYLDNPFLTPEQIAVMEDNRKDKNWWRVFGEGKLGQRTGVIYDFDQIDTLPEIGGKIETYGLDFGFTNDPSTLIHCLIDNGTRTIYLDEVLYGRRLLVRDLVKRMREMGISSRVPIYCDSAQPASISEIHQDGFNALPAYKGTRKAEQIARLQGYSLKVTKTSLNLISELRNYTWQTDKDGHEINEPSPIDDHCMDAFRYGTFTHLHERLNVGKYNITLI